MALPKTIFIKPPTSQWDCFLESLESLIMEMSVGQLHAFARRCALDVIHLWDAPSEIKEYLETGIEINETIWINERKKEKKANWDDYSSDAYSSACSAHHTLYIKDGNDSDWYSYMAAIHAARAVTRSKVDTFGSAIQKYIGWCMEYLGR